MERINIDEILNGVAVDCVVCYGKGFLPEIRTVIADESGERYRVKVPVSLRQRVEVGQHLRLRLVQRPTKKLSFECTNIFEHHESK